MKIKTTKIDPQYINWDKPNLLEGNCGLTVMSTGEHLDDVFSGIVLISDDIYKRGHYSTTWIKSSFRLSIETITISN